MMKTSLTIIPMCPRERFSHYKKLSRIFLCYKKDWAILLHLITFHYLLPVTNYPITKLFVTYNFSACREYLTENRLSFPSAPRWVLHSFPTRRSSDLTKLSVTYNFSACRENLTENRLSFPSAPRWVRHSYLSKGLR